MKKLRIAIVSPVMIEVPPKTYGGTQLMVYELAMGLANLGHQITLFCSAGSTIKHQNIQTIFSSPYPTISKPGENRLWEAKEMLTVLARQAEFDLVHMFYEPVVCAFEIEGHQVNLLPFFQVPVVCSFRNLTSIDSHIAYYRENSQMLKGVTKIFLSRKQKSYLPFLGKSKVIYNGLDLDRYTWQARKDDYLLFLGRITPGKGVLEAIRVARRVGGRLIIAAKICAGDRDFYEKQVRPLIDGRRIRYVGEVGFADKVRYLSQAKAVLFPITWEEPFGLVVAEALACGTPVISFRRGAMPEIIQDGRSGFVVDTEDEMACRVSDLSKIKPADCRRRVESKFTLQRMLDEYLAVYNSLLK
jgi:glycosyltransferase involved in cell wall biosynthesis